MPAEPPLDQTSSSPVLWLPLLAVTLAVTAVMWILHVPGSLLIGPMAVAIVFAVRGARLQLPRPLFSFGQAMIGCVAASAVTPQVLASFLDNWLVFTASVVGVLAASSLIGWLSSFWGRLPGTTGMWGLAPGGSTAMVLMAGAFGADMRLVAVMQYLRVILVTVGASLMTMYWAGGGAGPATGVEWLPAIRPVPFLSMLAVAIGGAALGKLLRMPAPLLLGPLVLTGTLRLMGLVELQMPQWLLAAVFAVIGIGVGLQFRSETLKTAWRALPQIVLAILLLMLLAGAIGWLLHVGLGVDPLTAYLATTPGGLDAVVVIALGVSKVDLAFVITLQTMRMVMVVLAGPPIARMVSRRVGKRR